MVVSEISQGTLFGVRESYYLRVHTGGSPIFVSPHTSGLRRLPFAGGIPSESHAPGSRHLAS